MTELQSVIQRKKRDGTMEGLYLTERDKEFIRFNAKWWCIGIDHFIRQTHPESEWGPVYRDGLNEEWRKRKYHSVSRRVNRLAKIEPFPPLTANHMSHRDVAYWCTSAGADLVNALWHKKFISGNTSRALHSWAATDIGTSLERLGYKVYSEREFAGGLTVDNEPVAGGKFVNALEESQSVNKDHGKRPDLAIAGEDDRFIFIEIEREIGRGEQKYRSKLESYFAHDRIAAVWYLVDRPATAKHVKTVYEDLKTVSRNMPVRVLKMEQGYHNFFYSSAFTGASCQEDLKLIGADNIRSDFDG